MTDSLGRLVADPLRKGSAFCMLHTVLFCVEPTQVRDPLVVYMDLETNSLDVLSGKIVEIGAMVECHGFMFCTVVNPGQDESIDRPSVHGIPDSELLSGPCFSEAFWRFDAFLRHASLSILDAEDDSGDEQYMESYINPYHGAWDPVETIPGPGFSDLRRGGPGSICHPVCYILESELFTKPMPE